MNMITLEAAVAAVAWVLPWAAAVGAAEDWYQASPGYSSIQTTWWIYNSCTKYI